MKYPYWKQITSWKVWSIGSCEATWFTVWMSLTVTLCACAYASCHVLLLMHVSFATWWGICDLLHLLQSTRLARGLLLHFKHSMQNSLQHPAKSGYISAVVKRLDKLLRNVSCNLYHIPECLLNLKWLFNNRMACISVLISRKNCLL